MATLGRVAPLLSLRDIFPVSSGTFTPQQMAERLNVAAIVAAAPKIGVRKAKKRNRFLKLYSNFSPYRDKCQIYERRFTK